MKIEFIEIESQSVGLLEPDSAINNIPEWFKKTKPIKFLKTSSIKDFTIKKCIPVLDAFTSGYYLKTKVDINYSVDEKYRKSEFSFKLKNVNQPKLITMHPLEQIDQFPLDGEYYDYAYKWSNPFVIKTPPGYSCLFTQPFNQTLPFYTLSGVVDTDTYPIAVQFPFLMRKGFSGKINAGTPVVQIIPFKRDDWEMSLTKSPDKETIYNHSEATEKFELSRYDDNGNVSGGLYKKMYRKIKRFR